MSINFTTDPDKLTRREFKQKISGASESELKSVLRQIGKREREIEKELHLLKNKKGTENNAALSQNNQGEIVEKERKAQVIDELGQLVAEELNSSQRGNQEDQQSEIARQKAQSAASEIEERAQEADQRLSDIKKSGDEIKQTKEQVEQLKQSAEGLLERTTSGALGEQFADRKSELEETLWYWKFASVLSISLLLISSSVIYYDITISETDGLVNISKFALIFPISVAVWFTVSNYRRQKKLMEEYEFKARMALSLDGFRKVLNEETDENNQELVAEFISETMLKIYSNPQDNSSGSEINDPQTPLPNGHSPLSKIIKKYQ